MSSGRAGAPSRSQQAFRWLLQGDEDEEGRGSGSRGQQSGGKGGGGKDGGRRRGSGGSKGRQPFIPGFKLRCDADAEAAAASGSGAAAGGELQALQDAFAGVLDGELVADVLASTGGDAAAAMEALLSLAGGGGEASGGPAAAGEAAAVGGEQATGTAPAAEAQPEAEAAAGGAPAAPCYWDVLPQEVKQLVFEQLSLRWGTRPARCAAWPQQGRSTVPGR